MSDRIPTFADLCTAIAEGQLPTVLNGSSYEVNASELRRYLNSFRSLPTISLTSPITSSYCDTGELSPLSEASIA